MQDGGPGAEAAVRREARVCVMPPVGRARENRKLIQPSSPEI
jgi:hypothetical protein